MVDSLKTIWSMLSLILLAVGGAATSLGLLALCLTLLAYGSAGAMSSFVLIIGFNLSLLACGYCLASQTLWTIRSSEEQAIERILPARTSDQSLLPALQPCGISAPVASHTPDDQFVSGCEVLCPALSDHVVAAVHSRAPSPMAS